MRNYEQEILDIMQHNYAIIFSGRELRKILNQNKWWWQRISAPRFYMIMSKLYEERRVNQWDNNLFIAGHVVRERCYTVIGARS